ncbi:HalX domain-containing protein [Salarchaeum japonicum]|uniref:HalX domain-containing protein n=1 Tax=Salarchaeum japonicum TaxID=555573 RepID=A0AAV3T463_9EURY|nr:HalX domain-containing protein [Salarchaeum japonicum]
MVGQTPRPSVLVVDDPDRHDRYQTWLPAYEVHTVESERAAADALTDDVHVVLLDDARRRDGTLVERGHRHGARVALLAGNDRRADATVPDPDDRETVVNTVESLLAHTAYDADLDELFVLCKRRAALLAANIDRSEAVAALSRRIDAVTAELDTTVADFATDDFQAAFRDVDSPRSDRETERGRRRKTYSHRTQ